MQNMKAEYLPLLGAAEGAKRLHLHLTEIDATDEAGWDTPHEHAAEEAIYYLEGEAEYTLDGRTLQVGPGGLVFFPAHVPHAKVRFLTPRVRYLVIRSREPGDAPCCCEPSTG